MAVISKEPAKEAKRILIVDDETAVLFAYGRLTRFLDVITDVCETYEEAIELINKHRYEIVITDIKLDQSEAKGGLDILDYMSNHHFKTEGVVMTGYSNERNKKRAVDLGVSYYFEKPLSPDVGGGEKELILEEPKAALMEPGWNL